MKFCGMKDDNGDICGETFTCASCCQTERIETLEAVNKTLLEACKEAFRIVDKRGSLPRQTPEVETELVQLAFKLERAVACASAANAGGRNP